MGDTAAGSETARLLVVGAIAATAACAATSLYWQYSWQYEAKKNATKSKKGSKARGGKKSPGAGAQTLKPGAAMSTTSTSPGSTGGVQVYEQRRAVDEYLQFHFGKPEDVLPFKDGPRSALAFTSRCAELCAKHTRSCKIGRGSSQEGLALDVGCAVGGASFELARHFREVVGIDFSRAFVQAAKLMKERGKLAYSSVKEADITVRYEGAVPDRVDRSRVTFRQGDACKLPTSLLGGGGSRANIASHGRHDAVLAANLLCRLPDPAAFLRAAARLVRPGGVLVLVSPYSWLEQWTPRDQWLGGFYRDELSTGGDAGGGGGSGSGGGRSGSGSSGGGGVSGGGHPTAVAEASGVSAPKPGRAAAAASASTVAVRTFDAIHAALTSEEGGFDLVEQTDQAFLIKEHDRKYQWGCSHATVWRRRREPQE